MVHLMPRKRVLIVNCYVDETRLPLRQPLIRPQAMAPAYLAGIFSASSCEIKLYDEVYSGPLEDEAMLGWPDMLVLSGLNVAFDRMLHLTAYARTKNRKIIVVAGGPAIKVLKKFITHNRFFDYICTGDIEQIAEVIRDCWDENYISDTFRDKRWAIPRYDLVYWMQGLAYLEASRNCYYRCAFCSLTAEHAQYKHYDIDYIRAQFQALGKRRFVLFIDNNFYVRKKGMLEERFSLLQELKNQGSFRRWGALVTNDFFLSDQYLHMARESGCGALFSGVESLDRNTLLNFRKEQNTKINQFEAIEKCLDNGIAFLYGLMFDVTRRRISELKDEMDLILRHPRIPLPSFWTMAIPLMGTPLFYDAIQQEMFLPNVRIRDMDGRTIILKTLDPINEVVDFVRDMLRNKQLGGAIAKHMYQFWFSNRRSLERDSMLINLMSCNFGLLPSILKARDWRYFFKGWFRFKRSIIVYEEALDDIYRPKLRVDPAYQSYFRPTMLTDNNGQIVEELREDFALSDPSRKIITLFDQAS